MTTIRSAKELWSDTEPTRPVLIMGNSDSVNLYDDDVYDQFFTIGCNSRLHSRYVPDLTLMIDRHLPDPGADADLVSQIPHWQQNHPGTVYSFHLGCRLQFHPDISSDHIDYSITSPYMAICLAYLMGWRNISMVGVDLNFVNGKNYHDDTKLAPKPSRDGKAIDLETGGEIPDPLKVRRAFLAACFNHLSYLINKMSKYHKVNFYSLSPHSLLLQNGNVKKADICR